MAFRYLAIATAVLTCWSVGSLETCGQTLSTDNNQPSTSVTMIESSERANRTGMSDADRGSFEATVDTEGRIGRSVEDVRRMLQELRGTERRRSRADMSVENLNERRQSRRRQQAQQNPPPLVHIQFQPSFSLPDTSSTQVADNIQARVSRLLEKRDAGAVQISLENRTATLTGTVKSEHSRRLMDAMVRIEPGVSAVKNLIAVEEEIATPQLAPSQ